MLYINITYVVKSPVRINSAIFIAVDIQSSHSSNIFGTMRELVVAMNQKYQNNQVKQTDQLPFINFNQI